MSFEQFSITNDIILVVFDSQKLLASTFMRFQEHYESPEFRDAVFTRDEFKDWYREQTGSFTYFEDLNGFNIPSSTMKPFYKGDFNPLHQNEKSLLDQMEDEPTPFYLIGVHKEHDRPTNNLKHETAHGLFHTDTAYRNAAKDVLDNYETNEAERELLSSNGYHKAVISNELHAYSVANPDKLKASLPEQMQQDLRELFQRFADKHHSKQPSID